MDTHLFSKLDPDPEPDPHLLKKLDTDPHKVNADPKHWIRYTSITEDCVSYLERHWPQWQRR